MKRSFAVLLLIAGFGRAAFAEELRVRENQTIRFEIAGATAVFVVDPTIADASVVRGVIHITGGRAGATTLTVVTPQTVVTYTLTVVPAVRLLLGSERADAVRTNFVAAMYDSETGRLTSSVNSASGSGARSTEFNATAVTHVVDRSGLRRPDGGTQSPYARTSFPTISFGVVRDGRQITFLDQRVQGTELQRGSRTIRGVHYQSPRLEVHAGWLSTLLYRTFILAPETSARLVSVLRKLTLGRVLVAPRVTWYEAEKGASGASGVAPGVQFRNATPGKHWQVGADLGYRRGIAAAANVAFDNSNHHFLVRGEHVPQSFPNPAGGPLAGSSFREELTSRFSRRFSLLQMLDAARHLIGPSTHRTGSLASELRLDLTRRWSVGAGSNITRFEDGQQHLTSVTVPLRVGWHGSRAAVSGIVRYQQHAGTNEGGFGGALNINTNPGRFALTGSVDYQRDAATLDVMFREAPELQRIFTELGLTVRTPEELSALVRGGEVPELNQYLAGLKMTLSPWRLQIRGDATWNSPSGGSAVRFSAMSDRTAATTSVRVRLLGAVTYVHRITQNLDLTGGVTRWSGRTGGDRKAHWSYNAGIRARFHGMPDFGSLARRDIRGRVFRDDRADGLKAAPGPPMPGVRMRLDTGEETVTGADGEFVFHGVKPGLHRVEAILPESPGLRFTTPSVVQVSSGQKALFGVGGLPGRVVGSVIDDVGAGIPGVQILLTCGGSHARTVTDTSGRFTLSGPEGACTIAADDASIPSGFSVGHADTRQTVVLAAQRPSRAEYTLIALRSIAGIISPTRGARVVVSLLETKAVAQPDIEGRFVFRNLKPGRYTIAVENGGAVIQRQVDVPSGPAVVEADLRSPRQR